MRACAHGASRARSPGTRRRKRSGGLALDVRQTLGGPASGGTEALFGETLPAEATGAAGDLGNRDLKARVGYGFGVFGDRWTAVPEFEHGRSESDRTYRLGGRLVEGAASDPAFNAGLEVTRHEQADAAEPEHGVALRLGWGKRVAPDLVFDAGLEVTRREQADATDPEHGVALGFDWALAGADGRGLDLRLELSGRQAVNDDARPEAAGGLRLSVRW